MKHGLKFICSFLTGVLLFSLLASAEASQVGTAIPRYKVLNDKKYETPGKAQVSLNVLLSGKVTEQGLKLLLQQLYDSTLKRTGFRYFEHPTSIEISAFLSKDRYESGMGQWVARLVWNASDSKPEVWTNERQLSSLSSKGQFKSGLTESKRMQVWSELNKSMDRDNTEVERRYPNDPDKQYEERKRLLKEAEIRIGRKHGITQSQVDSIYTEGLMKDWPVSR